MDHFHYRERVLHCEDVPLAELAERYGTPLFVYSRATLLHHLQQVQVAFAEAKPTLCFSIKTNGNIHIARLMRDHGSGLNPETIDKLFEPFFTTKSEGIGMGLAICRSIIEAHGGRLWAAGANPHGAVFQFTLPITTAKRS